MKEFSLKDVMECFHSRGQYLCKFIGTKEIVWIRKEFNSHKIGLEHQHGRRFIVLGHQYGLCDVMWIRSIVEYRKGFRGGIIENEKRSYCSYSPPINLYSASNKASRSPLKVSWYILFRGVPRSTLLNSCGGLPPGSSNPEPISHGARNVIFFILVFRPGFWRL